MSDMYIRTKDFKNSVLSGAQNVIATQEQINAINVFPVPDGDTGSNMAAAFENIANTLLQSQSEDLTEVCRLVGDAALNGSRGNSGAIIAQFFMGFAENIKQHEKMGLEKFAESIHQASKSARHAISNPVEGTIITVMHDWSEWVSKHWSNYQDFRQFFFDSLDSAEDSLKHTPDQLEILFKSHVVDAGAQGFVNFLHGIKKFLESGIVPEIDIEPDLLNTDEALPETMKRASNDLHLAPHAAHTGDLEQQYCTECIIHGRKLNLEEIRQKLSIWGDSMVVIGNESKVKVHLHTNSPNRVLQAANQFGEVLESKADDMWAQYRANIGHFINKSITIVTDGSCNLPQSFLVKHNVILIPLQIIINGKSYLERINLSYADFLKQLSDTNNKITTSQPNAQDIKSAFNKAARYSPATVGIFISSKLSGTYESIVAVAKKQDYKNIDLFDSRNVTGGLGLIIKEAANAINAGLELDQVKQSIQKSIKNTCTFISLRTIDYVVKGGRMKRSTGFIAKCLRLLPILKIDHQGIVKKAGITFGAHLNQRKMLKLALKFAKSFNSCELIVAQINAEKTAEKIAAKLKKHFPCNEIFIVDTTPALAAHSGPGTVAVSVLGRKS